MLVLSRKIAYLNLILSIAFIVSFTQPGFASEDTYKESMGLSVSNVRCGVEIGDSAWIEGKPGIVHAVIENVSKETLYLDVVPFFILENRDAGDGDDKAGKEEYWCPIDLTRIAARAINSEPDRLTLEGEETKRFDIDFASLRCGRTISAVWPDQEFFSVVQPGEYNVRLILNIGTKEVISKDAIGTIIK